MEFSRADCWMRDISGDERGSALSVYRVDRAESTGLLLRDDRFFGFRVRKLGDGKGGGLGMEKGLSPYPSWITGDPDFGEGDESRAMSCCLGDEVDGLVDCRREVKPFGL